MNEIKHPIQPFVEDEAGVLRFKENAIVRFLLDNGSFDLNDLATMPFNQNDREQFAQLIGYSLCGFGDLEYVSDETYNKAKERGLKEITKKSNGRIKSLLEEFEVDPISKTFYYIIMSLAIFMIIASIVKWVNG